MPKKERTLVKEVLYWSYANLAMAHATVTDGAESYKTKRYMIRSRLNAGLLNGTMNIGSLLDDEKIKMVLPKCCCYCGSLNQLSIDHLIPKSKGGDESGDNAVWACRRCNSSKHDTDLLEWYKRRGEFPPLLLVRRYLKLVIHYCKKHEIMGKAVSDVSGIPFDLHTIPAKYPKPSMLSLWQAPQREQ